MFFFIISNPLHTIKLRESKTAAHHMLQDIIKITVPEEKSGRNFTTPYEADENYMDTVMQQPVTCTRTRYENGGGDAVRRVSLTQTEFEHMRTNFSPKGTGYLELLGNI